MNRKQVLHFGITWDLYHPSGNEARGKVRKRDVKESWRIIQGLSPLQNDKFMRWPTWLKNRQCGNFKNNSILPTDLCLQFCMKISQRHYWEIVCICGCLSVLTRDVCFWFYIWLSSTLSLSLLKFRMGEVYEWLTWLLSANMSSESDRQQSQRIFWCKPILRMKETLPILSKGIKNTLGTMKTFPIQAWEKIRHFLLKDINSRGKNKLRS